MAKAPGKSHREGITLKGLLKQFPDDGTAEQWFIVQRWPEGVCCPHCGSVNVPDWERGTRPCLSGAGRKECAKRFSTKTGTVMEGSKVGYQDWLLAMFLMTTSLKSVSSMKLHRDLGVTQKTAWFLAHRIRAALAAGKTGFTGPVEVDEAYFGGRRKNMSNAKRRELAGTGRGAVGKTAVVGAKDRATKQVASRVVERTDRETLEGFIKHVAKDGSVFYTDESGIYDRLPNHESVKHSVGEYVRGKAHTNGVESFWSMLKRSPHRGPSTRCLRSTCNATSTNLWDVTTSAS